MKIYIIAGEASGDLHGSNLVRELKHQSPGVQLRCWGGDLMRTAGAEVVKHYRDLAFMGFIEVLLNLRTILGNLKFCKVDIEQYQPDALMLIDYPGFNLHIAQWAKSKGIPVYYYISPQIWAWKQGRIKIIRKCVKEMFVVLPFEKDYYKKAGIDVHFVGHPLLDAINPKERSEAEFIEFCKAHELSGQPIISLLPGSRKQEIKTMLPVMLEAAKNFPGYQFVVAGAPGQTADFYRQIIGHLSVPLVFGKTYELFRLSSAGLVTSGTATLEAGIFKMPQVVCYKGNAISYLIARQLVKVKFISLVNLILNRKAVTELIQHDFNASSLSTELHRLLNDPLCREQMLSDYNALHNLLGGPGASRITANLMLKSIES
ncbi:MAG: lipid-A-disaccharide synthase [Crocinitomicaceae bacterium]|nr:lipid-A-disaccharide synthase [Crocinitomicaceae bacterium]